MNAIAAINKKQLRNSLNRTGAPMSICFSVHADYEHRVNRVMPTAAGWVVVPADENISRN